MATAVRRKARLIERSLQEYRALQFAPLTGGLDRVDREAGAGIGIIRGVKVVGGSSPNKHMVEGVSGTDYTVEALRAALPFYEGAKVNCDHPERDPQTGRPLKKDRPARSRLGKLQNARMEGGDVYADLYMFKSHPMYETIMEAAESDGMSDCFALSHNAWGKGEVRNGRYVITHIPEVRSVDLVADGGTNRSLFESRVSVMPTIKLRELLESLKAKSKRKAVRKRARLLLEDDAMAPMMDADVPAPAGAEGGEGGEAMDEKDHIYEAFKLLHKDDPEMAKKLLKLLQDCCGGKEEEKVEESDDEDAGDAGDKSEQDKESESEASGGDEDKKKKDAMESRLHELEAKDACRTLCESLDFQPSAVQLKALMALSVPADRKALVTELKAGRRSTGPKSRSLHSDPDARQTQESAVPKDADGQLSWLMG